MRLNRGSSQFLTIAAVAIDDIDSFAEEIANLRRSLRVDERHEFHWAKVPVAHRVAYLQCVSRQDFYSWVLVAEKESLRSQVQALDPREFLCSCIVRLFQSVPETAIAGRELVIDDAASRSELVQRIRVDVSECMRERGFKRRLRGARGLPAHRSDGLQLADMIAGAVSATLTEFKAAYIIPETKVEIMLA